MRGHCSTTIIAKARPKHPHALSGSIKVSSLLKAGLVTALGFILAWRLRLAMLLGRIIWRVLPWLREA